MVGGASLRRAFLNLFGYRLSLVQSTEMRLVGAVLAVCAAATLSRADLEVGVPPAVAASSPCDAASFNVTVSVDLKGIVELDEIKQLITIDAELFFSWHDSSLAWDLAELNLPSVQRRPGPDLCYPEIVVDAGSSKVFLTSTTVQNSLTILHTGHVLHRWPLAFTGFCPLDLHYYPFDQQSCPILLYTNARDRTKVTLHAPDRDVPLQRFADNQMWFVERVTTQQGSSLHVRSLEVDPSPGTVPGTAPGTGSEGVEKTAILNGQWQLPVQDDVQDGRTSFVCFRMHLTRRSGFFLWIVLLPASLIAMLSIVAIFTTSSSDRGQSAKAPIGLSAFVALFLQMNLMSTKLPFSHDTPILFKYYLFLMLVITSALLTSVVLVHCHHLGHVFYRKLWRPCRLLFVESWLGRHIAPSKNLAEDTSFLHGESSTPCGGVCLRKLVHLARVGGGSYEVRSDSSTASMTASIKDAQAGEVGEAGEDADAKRTRAREAVQFEWLVFMGVVNRLLLALYLMVLFVGFIWITSHIKRE